MIDYGFIDRFNKYCLGVSDGSIQASDSIRVLVKKHLLDKKMSEYYFDYKYTFNEVKMLEACLFYSRFLKTAIDRNALIKMKSYDPYKYTKHEFDLPDFHIFVLGMLYGWLVKDSSVKRFSILYFLSNFDGDFELDFLYAVINYYEYAKKGHAKLGVISPSKSLAENKLSNFNDLYEKSAISSSGLKAEYKSEDYRLLFDNYTVLTDYNDDSRDLITRFKLITKIDTIILLHKDSSIVPHKDLQLAIDKYLNYDSLGSQLLIFNQK